MAVGKASRRAFIQAAGLFVLTGGTLTVLPRKAYANPVVLSAASQMMSLAAQFSKSGGGLSAMLTAQIELQKFVIARLDEINTKLDDLRNEIQGLPDEIRAEAREQFKEELIQTLSGQASLYGYYLTQSANYPETFSKPDIQAALAAMKIEVAKIRATLAIKTYGPEASLIVPIALAVELACIYKTEGSRENIAATINGYENWLRLIVGESKGSVPDFIRERIKEHDAIIDSQRDTRIGKLMDLSKYKIAGPQTAQSIVHPCVLTLAAKLSPNHPNPWKVPRDDFTFFRHAVSNKMTVEPVANEEIGVKTLNLKFNDEMTVAQYSSALMGYPPPMSECYIASVESLPFDRSKSPLYSRTQILGFAKDKLETANAETAKFKEALARVNVCRSQIGYATIAHNVATNCMNVINQQKKLNGLI